MRVTPFIRQTLEELLKVRRELLVVCDAGIKARRDELKKSMNFRSSINRQVVEIEAAVRSMVKK